MQIAIAVFVKILCVVNPHREPSAEIVARAFERAAAEFFAQ